MKKHNRGPPTRSKLTVLRQVCNPIPSHLVRQLAHHTGADLLARTFSNWSHVVALLYAQLVHGIGLNDVCDGLRLHSGPLSAIRGATPPSKNGLSHANKERPAEMAEQLFWHTFEHLKSRCAVFAGWHGRRVAGRFRRAIHVVDWTKHRRRKAAAKCHLRLDLQSFLPRFAILDTARDADAKRAREVCAGLKAGEIVIFDKAYVDFSHLFDLFRRGIWWVSWAKDNLQYRVVIKAKKAKPVKKGKENESGCQSQEGSVDESSMG